MDLNYNCPPALKEALHTRFKNGDGARLASSIKIGMRAAIQELKHSRPDDGEDSTNLEWDPLKTADPDEHKALQAIFKYLDAKGMHWTLDCLVEESAQSIAESQCDLVKLATMKIPGEEPPLPPVAEEAEDDPVAKEETVPPVPKSKGSAAPHHGEEEEEEEEEEKTEAPPDPAGTTTE
jgi:hypothetical protein